MFFTSVLFNILKTNTKMRYKFLCRIVILMAAALTGFTLPANAQSSTGPKTYDVKISLSSATLRTFSESFTKQTGVLFSFAEKIASKEIGKISINAKGEELKTILDGVFSGTGFSYELFDSNVVITYTEQPSGKNTVRGKVSDSDGNPMIGVGIVIKNTKSGVVTNVDGNYEIEAGGTDVLVYSYIGCSDIEEAVGQRRVIDVTMRDDMNILEEVVIVGYDTQKKVNLTGSVSAISTEGFEQRPITQASTALQGMAAGVTVTTPGGTPGSDVGNIQIRGIGSFGGSDSSPLVLIDGVEGSLNSVDASQIDQLVVLKDAASAAIYGSRAANGVILVTTKRASKGSFSLTYRTYQGWQKPVVYPSVVGPQDFMTLSRIAEENDGTVSIYTDEYIQNYLTNNYLDPDAFPVIDWQKRLMTGNGYTQNHTLTMSAGGERFRSLSSFGYLKQNGIIKSAEYRRYNLRNNMDVKINDKVNFRLDISGTFSRQDTNPYQNNIFGFMNSKDPIMLAQWSDGSYAGFTGGTVNPLPMIEQNIGGNRNVTRGDAKVAASIEYKPVKWLTLEAKAAPQASISKTHRFIDLVEYHSDPYGTVSPTSNAEYNSLNESIGISVNEYYHTTALASNKFGSHSLKLLLGASLERYSYSSLGAYRQEFSFPDYEVIDAGADNEFKNNSGSMHELALASFFGRLNYNYKERYLLEANLRYDGSSRFSKKNRWGIFPSFSAAWRVTEEPFMAAVKNTLTEFKVRASYGTLGNQNIGSYYPTYQTLTISSISANNKLYPIVAQNTLANGNITWETTTMADIGIDASLWGALTLTADYYFKRTDGILMQLDIPATIGMNAPYQNAGVVTNNGWELSAGYHGNSGDFTYGVQANVSDVINKIVDMKGTSGSSGVIRNQEGSSINSLYLLNAYGIIQTQEQADWVNQNCPQYNQISQVGDLVYEDKNGDNQINDNDKYILGSLIPRYTYGLTLDFGWKGINLSAQFQGVGKADAYISGAYTQPCVSGGTFQKAHLDNWSPENTDAKYPRLSFANDLNKKSSTFWMADASYLRLKNLMLSYSFDKAVLKALSLKGLMFYMNATNLFTLTGYYDGYDPETAYQGGAQGATTGSIGNNYPLVSTYTAGFEIKF